MSKPDATREALYPVERTESGVWMVTHRQCQSASREIAERCMIALGLDSNDFRKRDEAIHAISGTLEGMLNHAQAGRLADVEAIVGLIKAQRNGADDHIGRTYNLACDNIIAILRQHGESDKSDNGWQPIETVPEDGTKILVRKNDAIASWDKRNGCLYYEDGMQCDGDMWKPADTNDQGDQT